MRGMTSAYQRFHAAVKFGSTVRSTPGLPSIQNG
jgi:hypothetical protein